LINEQIALEEANSNNDEEQLSERLKKNYTESPEKGGGIEFEEAGSKKGGWW
jgi:hypothetical protein